MDMPPAVFDHTPSMVIERVEYADVAALNYYGGPCGPFTGYACAQIVLQKDASGGVRPICKISYARGKLTPKLERHEFAHCNGWPADHPNAIIVPD